MADVIWVIDTSSVIEVRRSVQNDRKAEVFRRLGTLVEAGRLLYPKEVFKELERAADTAAPDAQYQWAKQYQTVAGQPKPSFDEVKGTLAAVPKVLDPDKDLGEEEADPYVLAMAQHLRVEEKDARIVTEERKDTPRKLSLSTAAGLLGIPSVPLKSFLEYEGISY
jgi:hypothetical protein